MAAVPPTVRDLVTARLARLSTGTRRAVETAAVIGGRVDLSLLSSVLEGSSADECLATGILVADGSGVRFRHELVRMAVEAGTRRTGRPNYTRACWRAGGTRRRRSGRTRTSCRRRRGREGRAAARAGGGPAFGRAGRTSRGRGAVRAALRFANELDRPGVAALQEGVAGEYALLDR